MPACHVRLAQVDPRFTWWNQTLPSDRPAWRRVSTVILSLEGAAAAVGQTMTIAETSRGSVFGGRHREPMEILMPRLNARLGQREDELRRIADEEFLELRPHSNDTFDELFAKYEIAREQHRAESQRHVAWQEHTRGMLYFARVPEPVLISLLNRDQRGLDFRAPGH